MTVATPRSVSQSLVSMLRSLSFWFLFYLAASLLSFGPIAVRFTKDVPVNVRPARIYGALLTSLVWPYYWSYRIAEGGQ